MNIKTILIILGEPNSTFSEILFKNFKKIKQNKRTNIVLVGNIELFRAQMKALKYKILLNEIYEIKQAQKSIINIINVEYKFKTAFSKISNRSNSYIEECFKFGLKLAQKDKSMAIINGPVSKKHFLDKKFPGITEYVAKKTNSKDPVMLIYNEHLSVSPLTTHVPIKKVANFIKREKIINSVNKINNFYKFKLGKFPKIAVLGLNPHCETNDKISEEKKEIIPAIKYLNKKNITISGPYSADSFFLKKNINNFDVVIGMYHDQVLTPIKTLFKFNAINITIGLPFVKITPDHGPNHEMIGKNKSDPSSINYALKFLNKLR